MKRYKNTKASQYIIVGVILASIVAAGFLSTLLMQRVPFEDYFVLPWAAGRTWLLEGINPYDATINQIAEEVISESGYLANLPAEKVLLLPMLDLVFYLPFSLIPYEISRVLWVTIMTIVVVLIGYFSFLLSNWQTKQTGKILTIFAILLWVPGITSLITGHLSPLIILLLVFSMYLFLQGQDTTAGFILSLTAGSFFISGLLIIIFLTYGIIKRRWSLITAFSAGLTFLIIISLLLLPSWPQDWLRIIVANYSNLNLVQTPLMSLASLLPGIESFLSIFLHIIFGAFYIYLLISLRTKSERVFIWNTLAATVIAYLLNIRGSIHYLFIVIPALLLVFRFLGERLGLFGQIVSWALIVLLVAGSWFLYLPVEIITTSSSLPLFIIWLPILILLGVNWIRWWAVKIPKLPFESF